MTFQNPLRDSVLGLARMIFQSTPKVITQYEFDNQCTPKQFRDRMRLEFYQHRDITEPVVIERLVHKGASDWLEVVDFFTQVGHLEAFMAEPPDYEENRTPSDRILHPREIENIPPMPMSQEAMLN